MSILAIAALLLAGCSAGVEETPTEEPAATVEQARVPDVPIPLRTSINALMVAMVDHAGHALWDTEAEGAAPTSDADWMELEHHATQIVAAGTLITLGGTGQADDGWVVLPGWQNDARAMTDAAAAQLEAIGNQDFDALVVANGQLVDACEACHQEFKPELPTEGIVHPHY
jgi:hypothetical protein